MRENMDTTRYLLLVDVTAPKEMNSEEALHGWIKASFALNAGYDDVVVDLVEVREG